MSNIISENFRRYSEFIHLDILAQPCDAKYFNFKMVLGYMRSMSQNADKFLDYRNIETWLFNKNKTYSIPQPEVLMIEHLNKHKKEIRKYKLDKMEPITRDEVYESDKTQVFKFGKFKIPRFKIINIDILRKVLKYYFGDTNNFESEDIDILIDDVDKSSSSCYPAYEPKGVIRTIVETKNLLNDFYTTVKEGTILDGYLFLQKFPITIFHRFTTRLKKGRSGRVRKEVKIRQIWGEPFLLTLLESHLFSKAIKHLMELKFFSYNLKRPEISRQVRLLRERAKARGKKVICGDVKSIDSDHPIYSIIFLFSYLSNQMNYSKTQIKAMYSLCFYHIFSPVSWNSRKIAYTNGGNNTGSSLTSIMNSAYVLLVLGYYCLRYRKSYLEFGEIFILGDDFILIGDDYEKERLKEVFNLFGLTLSLPKTIVVESNEGILYLGFYWAEDGKPYQLDFWWIGKVCFPERYVPDRGWGRILMRVCSIVFQLGDGLNIFKELLVGKLKNIMDNVNSFKDINIRYYDRTSYERVDTIPLSLLINKGWTAF